MQPQVAIIPSWLAGRIGDFSGKIVTSQIQKGCMDMTFGEKLQDLRRKAGMSQDTLAEKLDVSRQAVSKWERDEAMPETDKLLRIARLFGVTTDYLLENETPTASSQAYNQSSTNPMMKKLERFIRRHGYKGGYLMVGSGAFLDLIALLFRGFWRNMMTSMGGNSMFDSYYPGFGMEGSMFDQFNQHSQQMANTAASFGNLFLILMIPGTALIALGIYIIIKGKKLSKESEKE